MRYFNIYYTFVDNNTSEFLIKSKSGSFLESQLKRYPNGFIKTSKNGIYTSNAISAYILEVDLKYTSNLSKNDFALINENECYDISYLE